MPCREPDSRSSKAIKRKSKSLLSNKNEQIIDPHIYMNIKGIVQSGVREKATPKRSYTLYSISITFPT